MTHTPLFRFHSLSLSNPFHFKPGAPLSFLLSVILATAGVSAAHATTIDNFTYTYSLSGNTFTNTFSLVDGQGGTASGTGQSYRVALNGDPAALATVEFRPYYAFPNNLGVFTEFGGLDFKLRSSTQAQLYDFGSAATAPVIKTYSPTNLTFNSGFFAFNDGGGVQVGSQSLPFDSSSLTITQSTTPDPTPVAATPEPGTLCLLGTGLLSVCAIGRRKLTGSSGASAAV